jgi:hypothetical protein
LQPKKLSNFKEKKNNNIFGIFEIFFQYFKIFLELFKILRFFYQSGKYFIWTYLPLD